MSEYTNYQPMSLMVSSEGWKVSGDLKWEIGKKGSNLWVCIPDGFVFDGPSIPWFARLFFNTSDPSWWKASALHDWLWLQKGWSKTSAAAEFYNALRADGVKKPKSIFAHICVLLYSHYYED